MRYQVAGHTPGWIYAARTCVILCAIGGAIVINGEDERPVGVGMLIMALLVAVVVESKAASIRRLRTWVEVLPTGLQVVDRHGEREVQDHEIVALSYTSEAILSNGRPAGSLRKCRLWTSQGHAIELRNKLAEGKIDPLADFIDGVAALLVEGFSQALEAGVAVCGDGWTLTKTHFRCEVGRRQEEIPLSKIAAIHDADGKLCVWLQGQEMPALSLACDGRNAWLLPQLVAPYLPQASSAEPPVSGLGRIIFKRRASQLTMGLTLIVGAAFIVGGGVVLAADDLEWFAGGAIVVGLVLGGVAAHLAYADFRCQEWGVTQQTLFGQRQLLYRDIEFFTYRAVRNYMNGAYSGTALQLHFVPRRGCGRTISHHSNVQGDDRGLENLRDIISQIIAAQMHTRLVSGETVNWTNNLGFSPVGLVYRPKGLLARKEPVLMPYENYGGYTMREGYFYLFEKGKKNAVIVEEAGEANFFPGFFLLLRMTQVDADEIKSAAAM